MYKDQFQVHRTLWLCCMWHWKRWRWYTGAVCWISNSEHSWSTGGVPTVPDSVHTGSGTVGYPLITALYLSSQGARGGTSGCIPLTAPPTAHSHLLGQSPWEKGLRALSRIRHLWLTTAVWIAWPGRAVWLWHSFPSVARVPPVAPSAKSAGVTRFSLCPVVSASVTGAIAAVCLTGAAELGVDVAGPSLPVCHRVATILTLSLDLVPILFQSPDQHGAGRAMVSTQVVFTTL